MVELVLVDVEDVDAVPELAEAPGKTPSDTPGAAADEHFSGHCEIFGYYRGSEARVWKFSSVLGVLMDV